MVPEGGGNPGSRGDGVRVRRSAWGDRVPVAWVTGVCVACIGTYISPSYGGVGALWVPTYALHSA